MNGYDLATWIALAILGPGALAVVVWGLWDLRRLLRSRDGK